MIHRCSPWRLRRALVLVAWMAGLAATLVTGEPARAVVPGVNGQIAFETTRDGNAEIDLMNPDGSGIVRVTTNAVSDFDPVWSPDGTEIAFTSARDGNDEIYVMNADGTGQVRLTTNTSQDRLPTWSPDGTKIAFIVNGDGNAEIYTMNADGTGQVNRSTDAGNDQEPAWSPDGNSIAWATTRGGVPFEIYTMNPDGSGKVRRTTNTSNDTQPEWSPDGTKIAFTATRDGNSEIYTMNADGTGQVNRSVNAAADQLPAWSPDGAKIAFTSARDGNSEVYTMNADGSDQVNRSSNASSDRNPDWGVGTDSDGDALLDDWEQNGIDTDGNGSADLDLPGMGAEVFHKDIFLELDVMSGHGLSQAAIDDVIAAFDNAPVANPDLANGINLHVDNGSTSVMNAAGDQWGAQSDQDSLTHQDVLGSFSAPNVYDWSAFDTIKAANFSSDREPAFHYVVVGHRHGNASNSSSGISRGINASDLLVTLGALSEPGEGSGTPAQQAGTLMHELGHNLGLRHGGNDGRNYKPNYLSIMNYSFQFAWLTKANGTSVLDYSRFKIALNENALNETSGFGRPASSPEAGFNTLAGCPGDPAPAFEPSTLDPIPVLSGAVDWNCNGVANGTVSADLNDDGVLTSSTSIEDWKALAYNGGTVGSGVGSVTLPATSDVIEPQLEELLRNEQALGNSLRPLPVAAPAAPTPPAPAKKCKKGRKLKKGKCVKKKKRKKR
jgi:Tol biopolymer transport system component